MFLAILMSIPVGRLDDSSAELAVGQSRPTRLGGGIRIGVEHGLVEEVLGGCHDDDVC